MAGDTFKWIGFLALFCSIFFAFVNDFFFRPYDETAVDLLSQIIQWEFVKFGFFGSLLSLNIIALAYVIKALKK